MSQREHKVTILATDEELQVLREVAAADSRTVSDWIRGTARRAHAELFGEKRAKPKRPRR
jgi:hypothetical protein